MPNVRPRIERRLIGETVLQLDHPSPRALAAVIMLLGCAPSEPSVRAPAPPPAPAPTPVAMPGPAAVPLVDAEPDVPTGAAAARDRELSPQVAVIVDGFVNSTPILTPDGKRVVFSSNRDGLPQMYIAETRPDAPAVRLTTVSDRVAGFPLPDNQSAIFRSDRGGDEHWAFYRIGLDGTGLVQVTPGWETLNRDWPMVPDLVRRVPSKPGDRAKQPLFYSARAMKDPASSLYIQSLEPSATPKVVYADTGTGFLADVSRDGKWALWLRYPSRTDNTLLLIDVGARAARPIFPEKGPVSITKGRFSSDGARIFVASDGGGDQASVISIDVKSGQERARYVEKALPTGSIADVVPSKRGGRLALRIDGGNRTEIRLLNATTLKPTAEVKLPLGTGFLGDFSDDGRRLTLDWSTPNEPTDIHVVDVASGKVEPLRKEARPSIDALPPIQASIATVRAFDGRDLPVNVYLPPDALHPSPKKLAVIVFYHGGPASNSAIRWSVLNRFFTSLGYAVVEPNVRGSSGFGRDFEMADNGPKRLDAFRDVEATGRWVAAQPWADPQRLVVLGNSYGGYTVLIALSRMPELWRAGVDLYGIADLSSFLKTTSGSIREVFKVEFGDLGKDAAFLGAISPLKDAHNIVDPLFVYAGANDPRVPRSESDLIVKALRQQRVPVEYMVANDEGHSMAKRGNQIEFYARVARFLETHLR